MAVGLLDRFFQSSERNAQESCSGTLAEKLFSHHGVTGPLR